MRKIDKWDEGIIKIILNQDSKTGSTLGELLKQYFNDKEGGFNVQMHYTAKL